jgi:Na+/melibiose symporter-like transporter
MMSDVDDYGDWKFGKRLTGISFAGNLFMLKMGLAVAGAIVAWILSYTGYIANKPAAKRTDPSRDYYHVLVITHGELLHQRIYSALFQTEQPIT